jgi:RimJ/RimL family protein N-acetyltransferase
VKVVTEQPLHIELRRATSGDAEMIFRWRNEPFIVARSTSQKLVTWDEHRAWYEATLLRDDRLILIAEQVGGAIGLARFDRVDAASCVISVYLLEEFTGRGLGVETIRRSCDALFDQWDVEQIIACVRFDNREGRSGFLKAGFMEVANGGGCADEHFSLILRREDAGAASRKREL